MYVVVFLLPTIWPSVDIEKYFRERKSKKAMVKETKKKDFKDWRNEKAFVRYKK